MSKFLYVRPEVEILEAECETSVLQGSNAYIESGVENDWGAY